MKARHVLALPYTRTGDIVISKTRYPWLTPLHEEQQLLCEEACLGQLDNRKILEPRQR
jgi:hypothetical protein